MYAEKSAGQRLRDRRVSGIAGGTPVSWVWWQHMCGREGAEVGKLERWVTRPDSESFFFLKSPPLPPLVSIQILRAVTASCRQW